MSTSKRHKFVLPELTRTPEQKKQFEEINNLGICPFCSKESFKKFHKGKIIFENDSWILSTNDTPYKGTKLHLLIVFMGGRHIRHISELNTEEWVQLRDVVNFAHHQFKVDSAAFLMRFGEPGHNGASVEHLHAHIIVGEGKISKIAERIRVKVGYFKK